MKNRENKLILYHGSEKIIDKPELGLGRNNNDYGQGFYCTKSIELAREWAVSSEEDGFANRYEINTLGMNILNLNSEDYTILNWVATLVMNRRVRAMTPVAGKAIKYLQENFAVNVNAYDIIIGYRADDAYYDFADAFLNNGLSVEQLAQAMKLGKLGEQVVLKSAFAFNELKFIGAESAPCREYFPRRKSRADGANEAFNKMGFDEKGLYMNEIIAKKITNDDKRIPRNISE